MLLVGLRLLLDVLHAEELVQLLVRVPLNPREDVLVLTMPPPSAVFGEEHELRRHGCTGHPREHLQGAVIAAVDHRFSGYLTKIGRAHV